MFSFGSKSDEEIVAIFDIGNGSIGGALVAFAKDKKPVVLFTYREPLAFTPTHSPERLLGAMITMTTSVAQNLSTKGFKVTKIKKIQNVVCFFSCPWHVSETQSLSRKENEVFLVNQATIDTLVTQDEDRLKAALWGSPYEKLFGTDIALLEKKVIDVTLNGYQIKDPIGKSVKELEVTAFSSFIATDILKKVETAITSVFHFKHIQFFSYLLASWGATRTLLPDVNDFLFFDISNEATDISLTVHGVLRGCMAFPLGRAELLRKIVKILKVPSDVALSFLNLYVQGTLEPEFRKKMDNILKTFGDEWLAGLTDTLTQLGMHYSLPKKVFVTVDTDASEFFMNLLKKSLAPQLNVPQNIFDVELMNTQVMLPLCGQTVGVGADPFLTIESIFIEESKSI